MLKYSICCFICTISFFAHADGTKPLDCTIKANHEIDFGSSSYDGGNEYRVTLQEGQCADLSSLKPSHIKPGSDWYKRVEASIDFRVTYCENPSLSAAERSSKCNFKKQDIMANIKGFFDGTFAEACNISSKITFTTLAKRDMKGNEVNQVLTPAPAKVAPWNVNNLDSSLGINFSMLTSVKTTFTFSCYEQLSVYSGSLLAPQVTPPPSLSAPSGAASSQ